ncbi:DUF5134 domain-containing protein [Granulicoccus sp. GXG6511]|uniref:DUF5134 domain-containing protein n=1 Tax=Granulicoccus sp. GXG6511 TaxID=3381351 RepID=UPI003D7DBB83
MFTLTDMPVKFVGLLLLFAFSTIWSLYQLARKQTGPTLVSNLAHLAMSVVMLLMVARTWWQPFVSAIPLPALVGFFGVFVLWFVYLGVRGLAAGGTARRHGWHALGHAAMFGAMTWHLAAMLSHMAMGMGHGSSGPAMGEGHTMGDGGHAMGNSGHAMDHAVATPGPMPMQTAGPGDNAMLIAIIGIPFMTYLLAAALWNLKNVIAPSRIIQDHAGHEAAGHGHYVAGNPRLAALADFAMNFGMFWMSTGLMVALLPFFRYLSF